MQPAAVPASGPAAAARPQPWDIPANRPLGPGDSLASIERTGAQVTSMLQPVWCLVKPGGTALALANFSRPRDTAPRQVFPRVSYVMAPAQAHDDNGP